MPLQLIHLLLLTQFDWLDLESLCWPAWGILDAPTLSISSMLMY
jgi:hypothetical protein